jgi:hypothetical protein
MEETVKACEVLGMSEKDLRQIRNIAQLMRLRRIARAEEASPDSVGGETRPRIKPPKKKSYDPLTVPLERWTHK